MFKRNKRLGFTSVFVAVVIMTIAALMSATASAGIFFLS